MTKRDFLSGTIKIYVDMGVINKSKLPLKFSIPLIARKYLNDKFESIHDKLEREIEDRLNRMELERGHPLIGTKGVSNIDLACWKVKLSNESSLSYRDRSSNTGVITLSYIMKNEMPPISYTIHATNKDGVTTATYTGEIYNLTARRLTKKSGYFYPSHISKVQFDDAFKMTRKDRGFTEYGFPKPTEEGWRDVTPAKLIVPNKSGGWNYVDKARMNPTTDYKEKIATAFQSAIIDTIEDLMNLEVTYAGVS